MRVTFIIVVSLLLFSSCNKPKRLPLLTTLNVSETGETSAVSGGVIYDEGDAEITSKGLCWAEHSMPTISNNKIAAGAGKSSFSATISPLKPNTIYHVRSYASNAFGTAYGNDMVLVTKPGVPPPGFSAAKTFSIDIEKAIASATFANNANLSGLSDVGVCWSLAFNEPTKDSSHVSVNLGSAKEFSIEITGLRKSTSYALRAYATNSTGTSYGQSVTFTTYEGTMTDIDNNQYRTVKIGNRIWMAENLRVTKYNNGTAITLQSNNNLWYQASTNGAYCYYNNDLLNKNKYGLLYNGYAASNSTAQIAPAGWHVPTLNEWNALISELGGASPAAVAVKMPGAWQSTYPSTNSSGFSALPGGSRSSTGYFNFENTNALFWTGGATFPSNNYAFLLSQYNDFYSNWADVRDGYSIRLIKD